MDFRVKKKKNQNPIFLWRQLSINQHVNGTNCGGVIKAYGNLSRWQTLVWLGRSFSTTLSFSRQNRLRRDFKAAQFWHRAEEGGNWHRPQEHTREDGLQDPHQPAYRKDGVTAGGVQSHRVLWVFMSSWTFSSRLKRGKKTKPKHVLYLRLFVCDAGRDWTFLKTLSELVLMDSDKRLFSAPVLTCWGGSASL